MGSNKTPVPYAGNNTESKAIQVGNARTGFHGRVIKERSQSASSQVGSTSMYQLYDRIAPRIPFKKRTEYYLSVGRVQNVVEGYKLNIINREWYYDDETNGKYEESVKLMENWEEEVQVSTMFSNMVMNWILNGVHIISPIDWTPLQLQTVMGKRRDDYGNTTQYIQQIDGQEHVLNANEYLELPYIDYDREAWPIGMFDSLMNRDWLDVDGKDPIASLELYRQALQDNMKIHHKYASPRVIYTVPDANEETIDNDITPIVEGMAPGDRAVLNQEIDIKQETVDGNARFIEHVNKIIDEIDTGLQSSANRLITEPSAMADAREAGSQDDDRTLGIMEKIRVFMNREVIPRITGLDPGVIQFKWGAKDSFDLEFPEAIKIALEHGVMQPIQARILLEKQYHWKFPSVDDIKEIDPSDPINQKEEPTEEEPKDNLDKVKEMLDSNVKMEMLGLLKEIKK